MRAIPGEAELVAHQPVPQLMGRQCCGQLSPLPGQGPATARAVKAQVTHGRAVDDGRPPRQGIDLCLPAAPVEPVLLLRLGYVLGPAVHCFLKAQGGDVL